MNANIYDIQDVMDSTLIDSLKTQCKQTEARISESKVHQHHEVSETSNEESIISDSDNPNIDDTESQIELETIKRTEEVISNWFFPKHT